MLAFASLVLTGAAQAQHDAATVVSPSSQSESNRPLVELVVVGSDDRGQVLRAAVASQALPHAEVRWSTASRISINELLRVGESRTMARCFIDLRRLPQVRIYFADGSARRFLIRDLTLEQGLDELGREALAQVLESSLEALLEPDSEVLTRAEVSTALRPPIAPSRPAPKRPRVAPTGPWFVATGSYQAVVAGPGVLFHGPTFLAALETKSALGRVALWGSIGYVLPLEHRDRPFGVELQSIGTRAGLGWWIGSGQPLVLVPRLGAGFDFTQLEPIVAPDVAGTATPGRWVTYATLTAALEARLFVAPRLALHLSPLADADFRLRRYDVEVAGARRSVLELWRVRPGLTAGVVASF